MRPIDKMNRHSERTCHSGFLVQKRVAERRRNCAVKNIQSDRSEDHLVRLHTTRQREACLEVFRHHLRVWKLQRCCSFSCSSKASSILRFSTVSTGTARKPHDDCPKADVNQPIGLRKRCNPLTYAEAIWRRTASALSALTIEESISCCAFLRSALTVFSEASLCEPCFWIEAKYFCARFERSCSEKGKGSES